MRYILFINIQKDAQGRNVGFDGYAPGHQMEVGYIGQINDMPDQQALGTLFETFNINPPRDYANRSMSVGDVALLQTGTDNRAYACESVGWKQVEVATINSPLTKPPKGWDRVETSHE